MGHVLRIGPVGIEIHGMDSIPVAGLPAPAPRLSSLGLFVQRLALSQQRLVQAGMALRRRDKADGAVAVFVVVPLHEIGHPVPGCRQVGKGLQRIGRPVFQGFE